MNLKPIVFDSLCVQWEGYNSDNNLYNKFIVKKTTNLSAIQFFLKATDLIMNLQLFIVGICLKE